MIDQIKVTV